MASFLSPMAQPRSRGPLQSCHSAFFLDGLSEQAPSRAPFYFEVAPCRVTWFAPRPCSQGQRDQENGSQVSHKRWKHWKLLMLKHLQGKFFFFFLTSFDSFWKRHALKQHVEQAALQYGGRYCSSVTERHPRLFQPCVFVLRGYWESFSRAANATAFWIPLPWWNLENEPLFFPGAEASAWKSLFSVNIPLKSHLLDMWQ